MLQDPPGDAAQRGPPDARSTVGGHDHQRRIGLGCGRGDAYVRLAEADKRTQGDTRPALDKTARQVEQILPGVRGKNRPTARAASADPRGVARAAQDPRRAVPARVPSCVRRPLPTCSRLSCLGPDFESMISRAALARDRQIARSADHRGGHAHVQPRVPRPERGRAQRAQWVPAHLAAHRFRPRRDASRSTPRREVSRS